MLCRRFQCMSIRGEPLMIIPTRFFRSSLSSGSSSYSRKSLKEFSDSCPHSETQFPHGVKEDCADQLQD